MANVQTDDIAARGARVELGPTSLTATGSIHRDFPEPPPVDLVGHQPSSNAPVSAPVRVRMTPRGCARASSWEARPRARPPAHYSLSGETRHSLRLRNLSSFRRGGRRVSERLFTVYSERAPRLARRLKQLAEG